MASVTPAPQGKPAEKRYELIPFQPPAAAHAVRRARNYALPRRDAQDADVHEAAHAKPQQGDEYVKRNSYRVHNQNLVPSMEIIAKSYGWRTIAI